MDVKEEFRLRRLATGGILFKLKGGSEYGHYNVVEKGNLSQGGGTSPFPLTYLWNKATWRCTPAMQALRCCLPCCIASVCVCVCVTQAGVWQVARALWKSIIVNKNEAASQRQEVSCTLF